MASSVFSMFIKDNFQAAGFLTVISYGISMILTFFLYDLKNDKISADKEKTDFRSVIDEFIKNRKFLLFLIASALIAESNQTITVFLSQIQYVRAGIGLKYMGYIYILVTVSGLLTAYTYKITEILGDSATLKLLLMTACISCLIMVFNYNPFISVACIVTLRISSSIFAVIGSDIQNKQIKTGNRATMLSIYSCTMNIWTAQI